MNTRLNNSGHIYCADMEVSNAINLNMVIT